MARWLDVAKKALPGPPENKRADAADPLAGVPFASDTARAAARAAGLTAAHFRDAEPSGRAGFTAADVRALAAG